MRRRILKTILIAIPLLVLCLTALYRYVATPLETADLFVQHVHAHRFDEAQQMLVPSELEKLPDGYWDELARFEFDDSHYLSSPNPSVLWRQMVSFLPVVSATEEGVPTILAVKFTAVGTKIVVDEDSLP
ncbi:MAG: hypothetical protein HUJ26_23550 [Planctomycetaceae bacterium]|nr:hypothetical protein [Planctomycetaceae bacterium]